MQTCPTAADVAAAAPALAALAADWLTILETLPNTLIVELAELQDAVLRRPHEFRVLFSVLQNETETADFLASNCATAAVPFDLLQLFSDVLDGDIPEPSGANATAVELCRDVSGSLESHAECALVTSQDITE